MSPQPPDDDLGGRAELGRFERLALALGRRTNERAFGKAFQTGWLRDVSYSWVRPAIGRRIVVEGMDKLRGVRPERGVLFASNHRSFFDQYCMMLVCFAARMPWARRLYFPVRANFFYEKPLGVLVNYLIAGGAMYPPIYRQRERRELNDDALDRVVRFLDEPGTVVGIHPEGTRGKGPDPYEMLPGQPGIGKIALMSHTTTIIPWFINGLGNDIVDDVRVSFTSEGRRARAVTMVIGDPVDLSDLRAQKPRPTLYKKAADRMMDVIKRLSELERPFRTQVVAGAVADEDPRWLTSWDPPRFFPRPDGE
jgi:1-acyl-sn-glycerol-3-phosphate acyltransferase